MKKSLLPNSLLVACLFWAACTPRPGNHTGVTAVADTGTASLPIPPDSMAVFDTVHGAAIGIGHGSPDQAKLDSIKAAKNQGKR